MAADPAWTRCARCRLMYSVALRPVGSQCGDLSHGQNEPCPERVTAFTTLDTDDELPLTLYARSFLRQWTKRGYAVEDVVSLTPEDLLDGLEHAVRDIAADIVYPQPTMAHALALREELKKLVVH